MNFKNFFLAVLASVLIIFSGSGQFSQAKELSLKTFTASVADAEKASGEYTYVRVFKDGIWWIYVYDGNILIDEYPED